MTAHLIDEAGEPTIAARDEILAFFGERLELAGARADGARARVRRARASKVHPYPCDQNSWARYFLLAGVVLQQRAHVKPTGGARCGQVAHAVVSALSGPESRKPRFHGALDKRLKGLEPSTFCMASRRSSQLSYSRIAAAEYSPRPGV